VAAAIGLLDSTSITPSFSRSQLILQKLLNSFHRKEGREKDMTREKKKEITPIDNIISDETGQFDLRFVLWRHFCAQNSIPVETLPSQLNGEQKEKWEELKASRLRGQK
jgi:hypothetical protein